jgi:hypothetical protein
VFTEDKVVPIDLIASATEDRVTLRQDAGDLQELPNFEEQHFVLVEEDELSEKTTHPANYVPALYWYPAINGTLMGYASDYRNQPYVTEIRRNIPESTIPLKEGAKVISADEKHVGNVERVFTDSQADRATFFVISSGLLLKQRKIIPAHWVSVIDEDEVHLAVGSRLLETVREYRE